MKPRSFLQSFKFAWEGLSFTVKTQRNMRIHILMGIGVILLALLFHFSYLEMTILCLIIISVLVCEVINTALELSLDFLNGNAYHPTVKIVKDVVAGGVLLASLNAVIVGSILFWRHL